MYSYVDGRDHRGARSAVHSITVLSTVHYISQALTDIPCFIMYLYYVQVQVQVGGNMSHHLIIMCHARHVCTSIVLYINSYCRSTSKYKRAQYILLHRDSWSLLQSGQSVPTHHPPPALPRLTTGQQHARTRTHRRAEVRPGALTRETGQLPGQAGKAGPQRGVEWPPKPKGAGKGAGRRKSAGRGMPCECNRNELQ